MPSHRVVVRMQAPDQSIWDRDQLVTHDGPPDWKLEPLDPKERTVWATETAQPDQAAANNRLFNIAGCFREDEVLAPEGMYLPKDHRQFPPSGLQG